MLAFLAKALHDEHVFSAAELAEFERQRVALSPDAPPQVRGAPHAWRSIGGCSTCDRLGVDVASHDRRRHRQAAPVSAPHRATPASLCISEQNAKLKERVQRDRNYLARITQQRDMLAQQESRLGQRSVALAAAAVSVAEQGDAVTTHVSSVSAAADKAAARLGRTARALAELPNSGASPAQRKHFVASHSAELAGLAAQETQFTKNLSEFTRKQFHEGFVRAALSQEAGEFDWLDVLDDAALAGGKSDAQLQRERDELRRLQAAEELIEGHLVDATVAAAQHTAAAAAVKHSLAVLQQQTLGPADIPALQCGRMDCAWSD